MSRFQLPTCVAGTCRRVLVLFLTSSFILVFSSGAVAKEGVGNKGTASDETPSAEAVIEAKIQELREAEARCLQLAEDARAAAVTLREAHGKVVTKLTAAPEDEELKEMFDELQALRTQMLEKQEAYRKKLEAAPGNESLVDAQKVALEQVNTLRSTLREETARKVALEAEIKQLKKSLDDSSGTDGVNAGGTVPVIEGADPS